MLTSHLGTVLEVGAHVLANLRASALALLTLPRHCIVMRYDPLVLLPHGACALLAFARPVGTGWGR